MKKLIALVLSLAMVLSLAACGGAPAQSSDTSAPAAGEEKAPEAVAVEAKLDFESMDEIVEYFEEIDWPTFVKTYLSGEIICIDDDFDGDSWGKSTDDVMTFSETGMTINDTVYECDDFGQNPVINGADGSVLEYDYEIGTKVKEGNGYRIEATCLISIAPVSEGDYRNIQDAQWNGNISIEILPDWENVVEQKVLAMPTLAGSFTGKAAGDAAAETAKTSEGGLGSAGYMDIISLGSYKGKALNWIVVANNGDTATLMCAEAVEFTDMGSGTGSFEDTNIYAFINGGFMSGFSADGVTVTKMCLATPAHIAEAGGDCFELLLLLPDDGSIYWTDIFHYLLDDRFEANMIDAFDRDGSDLGGNPRDVLGLLPMITVSY